MLQGLLRGVVLPCLVLGCACIPLRAAAAEPRTLKLVNFSQRLSKDVPVSGRLLVGAVIAPEGVASLKPLLLWRVTPSAAANQALCVTFASRDGVYYGEGQLDAASLRTVTSPVRVEADIEDKALPLLRGLPAADLAMLATSGDCGIGGGPSVVHLLDRRDSATQSARLRLMLNALTYTLAVEVTQGAGRTLAVECRGLDEARRNRAYDTECTLPLPPGDGDATLTIFRRRYERDFQPVQVRLSWAAP